MAFAASGLTRMSSGGGYAIWMYSTADAIASVNTASYWTGTVAAQMCNVGDIMFVYDSNTPTLNICQVNAVDRAAGTMDITDGTAVSQTDSD